MRATMGRQRTGQVAYVRGRWVARVLLHREPRGPNGRPRYAEVPALRDGAEIVSESQEAKAHARRYAARLQLRYDEGTWSPPDREPPATQATTVGAWVLAWLKGQKYPEAERDRERVEEWLDKTPAFRDLTLGKVTPQDVAAWLRLLRETPTRKGGPPAPRTVRNIADPVARALRGAVFEGLLVQDPFAVLPTEVRPQAVDANPIARRGYRLSRIEVETLLGEPSNEARWVVMWHLLVLTGMRVSEAIALQWCDLLDDGPQLLRHVLVTKQVHHRTREVTPLKTKDCREPPEHPLLREVLDWWQTEGWRAEYGREPRPDELIVPCRGQAGRPWGTADGPGGPLWSQDVHRALQRDLVACGIRKHRVHDFRHTLASLCADAGMDEGVASRWTHAPQGETSRHLYRMPAWSRQCEEMRKLVLAPKRRFAKTG